MFQKFLDEFGISKNTLKKYFLKTGDIYTAIEDYYLQKAEYESSKIEYKGDWIFEKYGILLKHLLLNNNVSSQKVVFYMRKGRVLTDENMIDEYDSFKDTFYVSDQEEECIIQSYDEIESLQRKLLLYEIAETFKENIFNEEEKGELLSIYGATEKEVETMFLDFYSSFGNKIKLSPKEQNRKSVISDIAKKWYYMTAEEREYAIASNNFDSAEQDNITQLSFNLTKYKNLIKLKEREKGVSFYGE